MKLVLFTCGTVLCHEKNNFYINTNNKHFRYSEINSEYVNIILQKASLPKIDKNQVFTKTTLGCLEEYAFSFSVKLVYLK